MFPVAFFMIAGAMWLIDSAVHNRSPITTLRDIIKDPGNARTTLASSEQTVTTPFSQSLYDSTLGKTVTPQQIFNPGTAAKGTAPNATVKASVAIAYAEAQVGKPYIWGGVGPRGYDCSGLCYMAYKAAGINIPRTTAGMLASPQGTRVKRADLLPGDLIFPYVGHVFMYVGNGRCVEAPHTGENIHYTNIYQFMTAIRYG